METQNRQMKTPKSTNGKPKIEKLKTQNRQMKNPKQRIEKPRNEKWETQDKGKQHLRYIK